MQLRSLLLPLATTVVVAFAPSPALAVERGDAGERGWTVHVDNDLFTFADRDRDYTAGFAFTLGGEAARTHRLSLSRPLAWLDRRLRVGALREHGGSECHALELGMLLFTPQDLATREPLFDDRPYANLSYVASSRLVDDSARGIAYQSSLTIGALGLPLAEGLHRAVHRVLGSTEPAGYGHQIAAGGEPTLRYAVSRYRLLTSGTHRGRPYSLRFSAGGSVGYLSELNAGVAFRWGSTSLPWWSAPPVSSDYAGHPAVRPTRTSRTATGGIELQLDAGVELRARVYNAFLEGQFRDSDVVYESSDLQHLLLEAWVGVTAVLENDLSISYTIRHQTEEIESGRASRGLTWASIGVAQRF
jgi:hypothetical protein